MTEVHITEGEVLRLHVQFRSDVEAYMKERGYLVDFEPEAECHALTLAIARERERCASPPFAIFEFDTGKPPVRATQEQVDAARKRFDRIMAAEIVEPENPCTHPAIEPQLVCEECGHREAHEPWVGVEIINHQYYMVISMGQWNSRLKMPRQFAEQLADQLRWAAKEGE